MQSSAHYAAVVEPIQPVPSTSAIPFTAPSPALNPPPTSKSISATTTIRAAKGKLSSSTNGADGTPAVGKSAPSRPRRPPTKLFRCSGYGECSMTFSRSEHLARHVRKHTGERPFKCHCGREFSRLDNVRQHASTVHGDMVDRNQDTLDSLAALHNELSVTTVQTQRDNGMILQNPTDRPRRRSYAADKDDAAPTKPRKERASLARRKAKGAAAASPAKAADDPLDAFPSDSNGNALQSSYTSLEGALEGAEPYSYNAGSARSEYTTGAGQAPLDPAAHKANFPPAPIHHQEIYGAMAPPSGTSVYPAMEFYAGASPTATYPTPPTQRVPALPSPQLTAQALTSQAPTPHPLAESAHAQYPVAEGHDHYAVPNASAAAFAAAPPPAEYPSELDALGGGKVSLPSISALLPASFAEGEGRLPGAPSEPVYGRAYGADSAPSFAPAPQHYPPPTSIPLQQAPSPSSWYGGPPTRPPSHLSIARHSPANVASYSEYPAVGSAIASHAASGEAALVQMAPQYSDQQASGIQPRYDHPVQADSTQPHWYGHPAHVPQHDMYGRTSSLTSCERNGPPSLSHGSSHTSSTFTNHSPHYPHTLLPQPVFGHQFHPAGPNPGQPHPSYPYPPALNHMYPTAPHQIQHTPSQHNQFPEHYSSYAPPDPLMPPPPPHHLPSAQLQPHTSHFSSTSQRYPDHDARLFADAENKYNMAAGPQYAHLYPPSADSAFAGSNGALTNSYSHPRPGMWAPQPQAQR